MNRQYFSMQKTDNEATVNIYGDISSSWWADGVKAKSLVEQLDELTDISKLNVYINSYGGEVAEGLAIYNALRRHKAKVVTHCEGFACSIASVIFMAGDERVMSDSSLLMIHNAWTYAEGNAEELRKQADDLEKITEASVTAYKTHSTLSEEEIKALMDAETWITPDEALEYGFATAIEKTENEKASQNARNVLLGIIKKHKQESKEAAADDEETPPDTDTDDEKTAETDENAEQTVKTASKTDENSVNEEAGENEDDGKKNEKKAAEKISGIFNAILKI